MGMQPARGVVLVLCTTVLLLTSAGITSFTLFLPSLEAEFGWSRAMVTLPYSISMVAWGIGAPLFGKLADDFGARRVILGGVALMAAGFLFMGIAQNLWQLAVSLGLMVGLALGACGLSIISLLVSKHFDSGSRGLAVSVVQTATPLNPLLFAPLLFIVILAFDWRVAALGTGVVLAIVGLPLAWIGARDPDFARSAARVRVGWDACLPYLRDRSIICLFAARVSCGLAFFQNAHLVALTISKGFDPVVGATALSVFGASSAGFALLFGWLADRYGRARILGFSYFVRGAGTLALAFVTPSELVWYLLVAVAIGPTFGTVAVHNVILFEAVGAKLAGVMLGLSFIVHQIGSSTGPLLGSIMFDMTATYDGFQLIVALILLASAAITFNLGDVTALVPKYSAVSSSSQA